MIKQNNPAARLHSILRKCREVANTHGSKQMVGAWRSVFKLGEDVSDVVVMSKVALVYLLPSQIALEIRRFEQLDPELYLGWVPELTSALTLVSFKGAFNGFTAHLTDSLLTSIAFGADQLSRLCPEKMVGKEELQKLRDSAYDLYQKVQEADLPPDLSRYLLDHLYLIYDAIDNYQITGARGLERAFATTVGMVVSDPSLATKTKESTVGTQFWSVVGKAALLLKFAEGVRKLGEFVGTDLIQ